MHRNDAYKIVTKLFWNVSHPTETANEAKKKKSPKKHRKGKFIDTRAYIA